MSQDFPLRVRVRTSFNRWVGSLARRFWDWLMLHAAIGPREGRERGFWHFGERSSICFPYNSLLNERLISIGEGTLIAREVCLSAGWFGTHLDAKEPVLRIGDRCVIGRGSGIVAHTSVILGDDVWTGPYVYITDQNHDYKDLEKPIGAQIQKDKPVVIGDGSWLGAGTVVLPGARIGRHVTVGANSVVVGELPDRCVAAGVPAKVIRRYVEGRGWLRPGDEDEGVPARD